jgi:Tol biopolymer transport system component/C-terminal processing protease CtpA/Prc
MSMLRSCVRVVLASAAAWLLAATWMGPAGAYEAARGEAEALPSFAEPGISPEGSEIAFVSGGDIWTVPSSGGDARLLVSHPATESRPLYSPAGDQLAFVSTRTGNGDIYVLTFRTGAVRRLTFDDGPDVLDGWSKDGKWIYFSSTSRDIAGMNDIFRVPVDGGTPTPVSADRYVNEYFAAPSPDGITVAFTARGMASSQWWRKGHSHIDESEIWLLDDGATKSYRRVTDGGAKQMWPMWAADGRSLFYVSDRSGAQNIWRQEPGKPAVQVTRFTDGRVLWPTISADGRRIAFERDFGIWLLDTATGRSSLVPISRRGAPAGPAVEHMSLTNQIQELALSPDGKKAAFVVRGEVFAASAKDGGDATRVTNSPANESQVVWAPDARRLVYLSDRDGASHLFMFDFRTMSETQLTREALDDALPTFSPDGKSLAFERCQHELRVLDLDAKTERAVATGYLADSLAAGREIAWSPDAKWIAYLAVGAKGFTNVWVVPAAGGEARQASFIANASAGGVSWSADGTFLLFDTSQRTEDGQLARVDLTLRVPKFREDQFSELFREETPRPPAPEGSKPAASTEAKEGKDAKNPAKPVEIVWGQIRRRLSMVPVGVDLSAAAISPDGKWVLLTASVAGQTNLYTYSLDELSRERPVARQLTSTPGPKSAAQFSPDSKEVYYLEDGRIQAITLDRRESRAIGVTAEMDVDFAKEKLEVFDQAWTYQRDNFFDPHFNGVDWNAVRAVYRPHAAGAATPDELRRIISLMVGELNASHLGISGPPSGGATGTTGRIGVAFDRAELEKYGRFRVAGLVPLGPVATTSLVKPGDYVMAVDSVTLTSRTNLDELLDHKVGRRVVLSVSAGADGKDKRDVPVRPVTQATEKGLLYREWVEANRAYVDKVSGGRLGYVHMIDMGAASLAQLYVDLDVENQTRDGVVVDVRNNNGGFVNAYAIDVLARRPYLTMTQRGLPATPARSVLGQRALEAPTILVTNQHSLSDAEDFTEGYRALGLGKVVGEPTAGWIIYTWSIRLIDGSSFRLPRTRITTADGSPMEMHPRPVDIAVTRPIGEGLAGRDSQLDAAVAELLKSARKRR